MPVVVPLNNLRQIFHCIDTEKNWQISNIEFYCHFGAFFVRANDNAGILGRLIA